jgi:hypothetical protein
MYKTGDYVKVIKSHLPEYHFLVDHSFTIYDIIKTDRMTSYVLQSDSDAIWADYLYSVQEDEIELDEH